MKSCANIYKKNEINKENIKKQILSYKEKLFSLSRLAYKAGFSTRYKKTGNLSFACAKLK